MRLDAALSLTRSVAEHEADCPEIGPICQARAEPPQRHHSVLWVGELRLLAEVGLTPGWSLQAGLPLRLVDARTTYTDLAGRPVTLDYPSIHHVDGARTGPGDGQLYVKRTGRLGPLLYGVRAGASLPIGKVNEDPYALGDEGLPHEHIQFGTGTWDPMLGADGSLGLGAVQLSAFAWGQAPVYAGVQGYQAGARGLLGVLASRALGTDALQGRLAVEAYGEAAERWHGQVPTEDGNQGRFDLYLSPGVTWKVGNDWTVSLDAQLRVGGAVKGAQLQQPLIVTLDVGTLLHLEDDRVDAPLPVVGADVADLVTAGEAAPLTPVAGKWTAFDFWAPWCEACPRLERALRERAASRPGLAVRRVNVVDLDSPIARQALPGVTQLPHLRLVAPDGRVALDASGTPEALASQLDALLP